METLAQSDEIDMLVLIASLTSETRVSLDAERVRATAARCGKPMTVWTYTLPSAFGREKAAGCGLFVHSDLRNVGVAMDKLAGYAETLARAVPAAPDGTKVAPLPDDLPRVLTEHQAKALLAPFGLPKSRERLAASAATAAEAAVALGFPVALKIASPDIPHKTEAGGVILGLQGQHSVTAAYEQIIQSTMRYMPDARIDGVLVQKVGLGGSMVELMGDVVHRPAPVDVAEATAMLRSLRSAPLLQGFRGASPIGIAPAAELIANLSQAAVAYRDRIAEMELNPVILHKDGSGLTIADALITMRE
jgi:acyl-CoA synthetase (NDP forming)